MRKICFAVWLLLLSSCVSQPPAPPASRYVPPVRDAPDSPEEVVCLAHARPYSNALLVVPEAVRQRYPAGEYRRSDAELQTTFTAIKSKLLDAYTRVMRERERDPSGHVILAIAVAPGGAVAHVEIVDSSLCNVAMEAKLLELVQSMRFPPVSQPGFFVFAYPISLVPT